MPSPYPNTVFVAPATLGSGDGSSAADAHRFNGSTTDNTWLQGVLSSWVTDLVASPSDVGINETHTVNTVKPGFEPGYFDADDAGNLTVPVKAYVTDARFGVWVRRVCFITDLGDYTVTTDPWCDLTAACGLSAPTDIDAGVSAGSPIRRIHIVGYRSGDSQRSDQVSGGTTSRSVTMPAKDPAADWAASGNYATDANGYKTWSGALAAGGVTKTWTVQLPSAVRARVVGNRTADPRTGDKHAQQWCVAVATPSTRELRDPTSSATEPSISDGAGGHRTFSAGQIYDPATGLTTGGGTLVLGQTGFRVTQSCIGIQGFEFVQMQGAFTFADAATTRFISLLDFRFDNVRYGMFRGDNRYDVEFARWQGSAIAQAVVKPGRNCQRWHVSDIVLDGQLAVGDRIQSLMNAANGPTGTEASYNAGAFRLQNLILEWIWDATPTTSTYTQGDGIDSEVKGHTVANYYADMCGDGGIDNKPTPYWVNWPAVSVFNAYLSRAKRAIRSWPGAQDNQAVSPHVLRNVTVADARQYGTYLVSAPGHHKYVNWWNPDGRANWRNPAGRTYAAFGNDSVLGDMDVVVYQPLDSRTTGVLASGMNSQTSRGKDTAPFRARLRTPTIQPGQLRVQVDGVEVDDGQALVTLAGDDRTFHPINPPSGATLDYTLSGTGSVVRAGDDAIVTAELQ